ncbi:dehydration response element B1A [Actinidia rufa]|uniref:Dehydration response element B1A n=1 Tax=Actinidia rufa TaxID=165716 RepID=A0A7J0HC77_9ERIC|nr:dehydration response element B1A [Actinidia rufa]
MNFEDESSTASSPSSPLPIVSQKRKAGRKKFKMTRHPVYRGIRRRNGNKWVCEVRELNKNSRIWLGTLPSPEMTAQAHDVAALALCGRNAHLNFPTPPRSFPRAKSASNWDIRLASVHAAKAFPFSPPSCSSSTNFSSDESTCDAEASVSLCTLTHSIVPRKSCIEILVLRFPPNLTLRSALKQKDMTFLEPRIPVHATQALEMPSYIVLPVFFGSFLVPVFVDEEELFNMPALLDSMAEGLLLTPPAMKTGFNWGDMDDGHHMDLLLW